jgi:FMN phosphatase YigB (HAD superfamily)
MIKAVIFDFGHTIMNEVRDRDVPFSKCRINLMPGVLDVLPQISLPMGIWANTRRVREHGLRNWLVRAGINQYFTWIVTSVEAGHRKPDKKFFSFALKKCGLKKNEVLFVGNQLNTDIQGAVDYGITNVWLSGPEFRSTDDTYKKGQVEPTYTIPNLQALPRLLKKPQL